MKTFLERINNSALITYLELVKVRIYVENILVGYCKDHNSTQRKMKLYFFFPCFFSTASTLQHIGKDCTSSSNNICKRKLAMFEITSIILKGAVMPGAECSQIMMASRGF